MNKIKFFIAATVYPKVLEKIYDSAPLLKGENYESQYKKILDCGFGWSGYWKKNLERSGGFIVQQIFANADKLQRIWATENGIDYNSANDLLDVLEKQIEQFEPDVIFDNTAGFITAEFRQKIRAKHPSIKLIIGWDGVAENNAEKFSHIDIMLSPLEHVVAYYKQKGFRVYQFPLAFESSVLDGIIKREPIYDVSFVGSVFVGRNFHIGRLRFLVELSKNTKLDLWASGLPKSLFSWGQVKRLLKGEFKNFIDIQRLININRGELFGLEMLQVLADSKITLNSHIDSAGGKSGNFRLFEATGVGSCLLTDWKENIGNFFEPDKEIVIYKTIPEAVDKIKYLLQNENIRKSIALAGQKRTLESNNFESRIRDFIKFLLANL